MVTRERRIALTMPRRSPLTSVTLPLSIATSGSGAHGDADVRLGGLSNISPGAVNAVFERITDSRIDSPLKPGRLAGALQSDA
jgi:hypothetical protein